MANQERRRALIYGLVFSFTLMATPVQAFGLKSLTDKLSGGGGGGSWSKIVTDWRDGLGGLSAGEGLGVAAAGASSVANMHKMTSSDVRSATSTRV